MLHPGDANNIINSYLSPEWFKCNEQMIKEADEGRHDDVEAWRKLRDHQKYLANELRKASGQPVQ